MTRKLKTIRSVCRTNCRPVWRYNVDSAYDMDQMSYTIGLIGYMQKYPQKLHLFLCLSTNLDLIRPCQYRQLQSYLVDSVFSLSYRKQSMILLLIHILIVNDMRPSYLLKIIKHIANLKQM